MLVSTTRYVGGKARELAKALALSTNSPYSARGKKTVERLVSEARKKGENTLALVSESKHRRRNSQVVDNSTTRIDQRIDTAMNSQIGSQVVGHQTQFANEISFISISPKGWNWKKEILLVKKCKIGEVEECEIGNMEGKDAHLFERLFGMDSFYGGEATLFAETGILKFMCNGNCMLEIDYEIKEGNHAE